MYVIELEYNNPGSGEVFHNFFPDLEVKLARDYFDDAKKCGCEITIWRLIPIDKIHVG